MYKLTAYQTTKMKLVIQLVSQAQVHGESKANAIKHGAVIYVGFCKQDTPETITQAVNWLKSARIFPDNNSKINLTISQVGGTILVIPNFTLCAAYSQRRPSFSQAALPQKAQDLFKRFITTLKNNGIPAESGFFREMMKITQTLVGPYTYVVDF